MTCLFLADGFETIEALTPIDMLRRAEIPVCTVSITDSPYVKSSQGVVVKADLLFDETDFSQVDLLILPGGMPGAVNLLECGKLCHLLKLHGGLHTPIAAICAAPMVLGVNGLLEGKKATAYPGFEDHLTGATYTGAMVETDGNIITAKGPAAAVAFARALVALLKGESVAQKVCEGMLF